MGIIKKYRDENQSMYASSSYFFFAAKIGEHFFFTPGDNRSEAGTRNCSGRHVACSFHIHRVAYMYVCDILAEFAVNVYRVQPTVELSCG